MNLKRLINKAINAMPPVELLRICGEYYEPYYHLMYLLASRLDNGFCVELGVHTGRGVASMAMANRHNLIVGFDTSFKTELNGVLESYPNILFFQRASMPVPIDVNRPINILHIDTEHSYSMAKAEFEAYQPYLAKGAAVLFDDLHAMDDDVMRYFKSLPYKKWNDDRLHPSCGYGVLIYE
jgi:hypothetical protein